MSREESVHGRLRFGHKQMTENARGKKAEAGLQRGLILEKDSKWDRKGEMPWWLEPS